MPDLAVRIKKKTDGTAALRCERADGSVTWQRQDGQLGRFFPLHDLTHLAVESVLGFREAFYGLIASGWDISTFAEPGANRRLPVEAHLAEVIVGFFDLELRTGGLGTAADFNAKIHDYFTDKKLPPPAFAVRDDQVDAVRARRAELFAQWRALPAGDTMDAVFTVR